MLWDGYTRKIQNFAFLQDAAAACSSEGAVGAYVGSSWHSAGMAAAPRLEPQQQEPNTLYVIWYHGRMYKKL